MFDKHKWWPSLKEYDPQISEEKWFELLKDKTIFDEKSLTFMKRLIDNGGQATCAELSLKYGLHASAYVGITNGLATHIKEKINCEYAKDGDREVRFPVLFVGQFIGTSNDYYIWKLRPELASALTKIKLDDYPLYEPEKIEQKISDRLAQIIEIYKDYLHKHPETFGNELYKWQLITDTKSMNNVDIALELSKSKYSLIDNQRLSTVIMLVPVDSGLCLYLNPYAKHPLPKDFCKLFPAWNYFDFNQQIPIGDSRDGEIFNRMVNVINK